MVLKIKFLQTARRLLGLSLLGLVVPLLLADPTDAPPVVAAAAPLTPIPHVKVAPTIDGVLDDACWANAVPVVARYRRGQAEPLAEPTMKAYLAWDEHFLYVAYDLTDKNLVALGTGRHEGEGEQRREVPMAWLPEKKLDLAEVFVSFDDPNFFWELHHNAANHFGDVWCTVPEPSWPLYHSSALLFGVLLNHRESLINDREYTFDWALRYKLRADGRPSTVNDPSDVDTGYTTEMRLPWAALGAPKERCNGATWDEAAARSLGGKWQMAGQILRLLVVQLDGDVAPEPYSHTIPGNPPIRMFHTAARFWPRYQLMAPLPSP
jgi:hypothetical protein